MQPSINPQVQQMIWIQSISSSYETVRGTAWGYQKREKGAERIAMATGPIRQDPKWN